MCESSVELKTGIHCTATLMTYSAYPNFVSVQLRHNPPKKARVFPVVVRTGITINYCRAHFPQGTHALQNVQSTRICSSMPDKWEESNITINSVSHSCKYKLYICSCKNSDRMVSNWENWKLLWLIKCYYSKSYSPVHILYPKRKKNIVFIVFVCYYTIGSFFSHFLKLEST